MPATSCVPAARYKLVAEGEGGPPTPRAARALLSSSNWRAVVLSSSQLCNTPSCTRLSVSGDNPRRQMRPSATRAAVRFVNTLSPALIICVPIASRKKTCRAQSRFPKWQRTDAPAGCRYARVINHRHFHAFKLRGLRRATCARLRVPMVSGVSRSSKCRAL